MSGKSLSSRSSCLLKVSGRCLERALSIVTPYAWYFSSGILLSHLDWILIRNGNKYMYICETKYGLEWPSYYWSE